MQPPKPLKKEQLEHPNDTTYKAWNGDERKRRSDRWNGAPSFEDKGFTSRGVTVTEGTRAPSNVRPAVGRPGLPQGPPPQLTRAVSPPTSSKPFQPALRPVEPFNLPELTARQKALLKKKK